MEELLDAACTRTDNVGAALAVRTPEGTSLACTGHRELARDLPVIASTPFQIASITKMMQATVLALLESRGALSFDDPVSKRVPELSSVPWADRVTLRQLMAGTSGIPLNSEREFAFPDGPDGLARFATALASTDLMHEPGAAWSYSNSSWALLGRALEVAVGSDWESAMTSELLKPNGLHETTFRRFDADTSAHHNLATPKGFRTIGSWHNSALAPAGAAIWSTVEDLIRFGSMHLDRFTELREVQSEPQITAYLDDWCLGMARFNWPGGTAWGWDGVGGGHRAFLRVIPEAGIVIALLVSSSNGRALYRDLMPTLLRDHGIDTPALDLDPKPGSAGDLSRFAGTFGWEHVDIRVKADGDTLVIDFPEGQRVCPPINDRSFLLDAAAPDTPTLTFGGFDSLGVPQMLHKAVWGMPRKP